jgi:hypothetical protein
MVYVFIKTKMYCTAFGEVPKQWGRASGSRIRDIVPQCWSRLASNGAADDHVGLFYMRPGERSPGNPKLLN